MGIGGLVSGGGESARELVGEAAPAVIRIQDDGVSGLLMSGGTNAKPGAVYRLVDVGGRGESLEAVLKGKAASGEVKAVPRTGPGDVIVVSGAYAKGAELLCGGVSTRVHDDMAGPVQVMRILARPSAVTVGKHGAHQSVKVADPSLAETVGSSADLSALMQRMRSRKWPGGELGFILRNANKAPGRMSEEEWREAHEIAPDDRESDAAFVKRLVEVNDILSAGPVEAVPTWRMPLARAHMYRENVDLKTNSVAPRTGAITAAYQTSGSKPRVGFLPTFVILSDDDEWAFGAKTGKRVRTCQGLQPARSGDPVMRYDIATRARATGRDGKPRSVVVPASLFKDDDAVEAARRAREARGGKSATRSAPAAGPAPSMPPRSPVISGPRPRPPGLAPKVGLANIPKSPGF